MAGAWSVAPQEYGIERAEKEEIGLLTSLPLLEQMIGNLKAAKENNYASADFYFTKESHMCVEAERRTARVLADSSSCSHTLVNLVTLSDLPIVMPQVPELDYMSYIA